MEASSLAQPATARPVSPSPGFRGPVHSLAIFEHGGKTVVQGVADDGSSLAWDAVTGATVDEVGIPDAVTGAAVSRDGSLLAGVVDADGDGATDVVRLYRDGAMESEAAVETGSAEHLQFRPDGNALAWSEGSVVRLWDLSTPPTTVLGEVASGITSLRVQPRRGAPGRGRGRGEHLAGRPGRAGGRTGAGGADPNQRCGGDGLLRRTARLTTATS